MSGNKLRLRHVDAPHTLLSQDWKQALSGVEPDPVVGIRHTVLDGEASFRTHLAEIPQKVGCHYHKEGDEDYIVLQGAGRLHWGAVSDDGVSVAWEAALDVSAGDLFTIPPG